MWADNAVSVYLVLGLANLLGGVTKGVTGFGSAILNLCTWIIFVVAGIDSGSLRQAVVCEALASTVIAPGLLYITKAHATADLRMVAAISLFVTLSSPMGAAILVHLDAKRVELVMASTLLLIIIVEHLSKAWHRHQEHRHQCQLDHHHQRQHKHHQQQHTHQQAGTVAASNCISKVCIIIQPAEPHHHHQQQEHGAAYCTTTAAVAAGYNSHLATSSSSSGSSSLGGLSLTGGSSSPGAPPAGAATKEGAWADTYVQSMGKDAGCPYDTDAAAADKGEITHWKPDAWVVASAVSDRADYSDPKVQEVFGSSANSSNPGDCRQMVSEESIWQSDSDHGDPQQQEAVSAAWFAGAPESLAAALAVTNGAGPGDDISDYSSSADDVIVSPSQQRRVSGRADVADSLLQPLLPDDEGEGDVEAPATAATAAAAAHDSAAAAAEVSPYREGSSRMGWLSVLGVSSIAGTLSGIMEGLTGMNGPPIMFMYRSLNTPKAMVRGNNAFLNLLQMRLIPYYTMGMITAADLQLYLVACCAGAVGVVLGDHLSYKMDQRVFQQVLGWLMVLCCGLMFASGLGLV